MHRITILLVLAVALSACAQTVVQPTATPTASASVLPATPSPRPMPAQVPGLARLEPADGAYFGVNLDWGHDSAAALSQRLGRTPVVWVQFVSFPMDKAARAAARPSGGGGGAWHGAHHART